MLGPAQLKESQDVHNTMIRKELEILFNEAAAQIPVVLEVYKGRAGAELANDFTNVQLALNNYGQDHRTGMSSQKLHLAAQNSFNQINRAYRQLTERDNTSSQSNNNYMKLSSDIEKRAKSAKYLKLQEDYNKCVQLLNQIVNLSPTGDERTTWYQIKPMRAALGRISYQWKEYTEGLKDKNYSQANTAAVKMQKMIPYFIRSAEEVIRKKKPKQSPYVLH